MKSTNHLEIKCNRTYLRTCMRGWLIPCNRSTTWWWGLPTICRNTIVRLLFHRGDIRRRIITVLRPWRHELWISSKTRTTWRNVRRRAPGLRRAPMLGRWHWLLPRHTMHFHLQRLKFTLTHTACKTLLLTDTRCQYKQKTYMCFKQWKNTAVNKKFS